MRHIYYDGSEEVLVTHACERSIQGLGQHNETDPFYTYVATLQNYIDKDL